MNHIKTIAKFLFGFPLTIAAFYFIGGFILRHWEEVEINVQKINIANLLIGFLFLFIFFLLRSLTWNKFLEKEGYPTPSIESTYLLAISEIKRYIPGSVLGLISRVKNFDVFKIPGKMVMKLIFYESAVFLITNVIISLPSIVFLLGNTKFSKAISPTLTIILLITIIVICAILYMLPKKHSKKVADAFIGLFKYRVTFLYMFVAWIFFGLGNYMVGSSLHVLEPARIIGLSSLFALSWLVGYVVIIAPLGLGVREAVITYGLATIIPLPIAAAISIITRVALVLTEILFLSLSFASYKFFKKQ